MQIKLHTSAPLSDETVQLHLPERLNVITVEGHSLTAVMKRHKGEEKSYIWSNE